MSKGFLGVIIAIILVFAGIFAFNSNKTANAPDKKSSGTPTNHIEGKGSSGITLVEYGDYQCPFCGAFYPIVKQVQAKYNDRIFFQFRNYPLQQHQNALAAARVAESAGLQNKFWEMNNALFETQKQWGELGDAVPFFNQLAEKVGLDMPQFKKDFVSSKVNDLINADKAEGNKVGVTSTPTFFLDGKKINVTQSVESFEKAIDEALAKKNAQ